MNTLSDLRAAAQIQMRVCTETRAHTYAAIMEHIIGRLDALDLGTKLDAVTDLVMNDPRDVRGSALYPRLLGAVHRIVLDHPDEELARWYPTAGGVTDVARAVPAFFELVERRHDEVASEMQVDVQTNEVGRSIPLAAAMSWVSERFGMPFALYEVGASGGLNLWLDRYHITLGNSSWGSPDSLLRLAGELGSGKPGTTPFRFVTRRGCDQRPLDVQSVLARRILRSFVWSEHVDRLARLDRALEMFSPIPLERSGAVDWVAQQVRVTTPGAVSVFFHSIVMPYLSREERTALDLMMIAAGVDATFDSPLVRVAMEPVDADYTDIQVACDVWPPGERVVLATCSPHGDVVYWNPGPVLPVPGTER